MQGSDNVASSIESELNHNESTSGEQSDGKVFLTMAAKYSHKSKIQRNASFLWLKSCWEDCRVNFIFNIFYLHKKKVNAFFWIKVHWQERSWSYDQVNQNRLIQ